MINKMPGDLDLTSLEYRIIDQRLHVTDGRAFSRSISEFGPTN